MTKKFLALTMVLVLAAGFAAVAAEHEDDRALEGTWENELYLSPTADETFAGYDSVLDVDYTTGGISYSSKTSLNLSGMTEQEFGVDSSIGLLDLSSTLNMDVGDANLRFWESSADLTLGGVSIGSTFYLQNIDWDPSEDTSYSATFWPEVDGAADYPERPTFGSTDSTLPQTASVTVDGTDYDDDVYNEYFALGPEEDVGSFHSYGSGLELTFSGETPGGVSVDVTNTFGMMPTSDLEADLQDDVDAMVEDDLLDSAGEDELSDVTAEKAEDWLAGLIDATETSEEDWYILSAALLVDQIGIGDADDSGEEDSTFVELAEDFEAWVAEYVTENDPGYSDPAKNADSDLSEKIRTAVLNIVQQTVTISGVAGETGKVVNTEYELGDLEFYVDAEEPSSDASIDLVLDTVEVGPAEYGGSSLQYYSTLVELDNLSIGCCDFSNETKFTEHDGFAYSEFDFSMSMETFPIDIDATLEWDGEDGKGVSLTPSLSTDWSCFTVHTDLGSADGDIDSLTVEGFEISAEMGHVNVTSITALGDHTVYDLDSSYHAYDEVIAIDKLASAGDLDFGLDYYTDMGSDGNGFMPVALEGTASYPISSQFDLGTGLAWVDDDQVSSAGLQEVSLTFDYSF